MTALSQAAVFVDRDGVINRHRTDSVKAWSEFEFLPGALDGLAILAANGYRVVIVTNQANVGRGILTASRLEEIHRRMAAAIEAAGGLVAGIRVCPHLPSDGCRCRKPAPGLLLDAARDLQFPLETAYLVGDDRTDLMAAQSAGVRTILVLSGREQLPLDAGCPIPDYIVADLAAAARLLTGADSSHVDLGLSDRNT